jgi:hypothetical protein
MIVVATRDGEPTSIELRDGAERRVDTKARPPNREEARDLLERAVCQLGGLLAVLDGPEPAREGTGTTNLVVLKPAVPDAKNDVAMLCNEPAGMPGAADPIQRVRMAFTLYEETLTTGRWRAWLRDLADEHSTRANDDAARRAARERAAAELDAAAAREGPSPCWFAAGLRKP